MRLYQVEVGATYWIVLPADVGFLTVRDARSYIEDLEGEFPDDEWEGARITECDESAARALICRGESPDEDIDMWAAAEEALIDGSEVVACSEWP